MKYFGFLMTLPGALIMVASAYFPYPCLQPEAFGGSLTVMLSGLLAFFIGSMIMAKHDEEFMERMMGRIGELLEII